MASFDSIVNVEEWISDYFLTSDEKGSTFTKCVADRLKEWDKEESSPWTLLKAQVSALQLAFSADLSREDALNSLYDQLDAVFAHPTPEPCSLEHGGAELLVEASRGAEGSLLVLRAQPLDTVEGLQDIRLLRPATVRGKDEGWSLHQTVGELFLSEPSPQFILVWAGNWAIIAERESWPLGRFLAVNVSLAVERNDKRKSGELARVAVMLARENLERAADHSTWWLGVREEARNHSVKVSADLREAIKQSIEVIGNDVVNRHRAQGLGVEGLDGNELAHQALRYLYRILFLLFAEASPELEILPTGDADYDEGYGLTRLRDLILTDPTTVREQQGTHLYESVQLLFHLIDHGHDPLDGGDETAEPGLTFRSLSADLFQPQATRDIDRVKLSNQALTTVLRNLLLSKEQRGRDRGFISYATLGVSELGQVYEGLMSYTGFLAEEDLFEVAPKGNPEKGSWVLPQRAVRENPQVVPEDSFITEDVVDPAGGYRRQKRSLPRGSFVYRQSSRDRERSASFYTPPVITEFTVRQAIEELEASGRISCADDVLRLSICEPAMGSGAFAVETVNQLAELYIQKKQEELGRSIAPERRAQEVQRVKAYLALHQVYGVDLNATAVELAEISLWLNTMTADLKAPWFGLHLRRGNSLIGAARATLPAKALRKKDYLKESPTRHGVMGVARAVEEQQPDPATTGRIHHFLLPSMGWGSAAESKDLKELVPDDVKALTTWRKSVQHGLGSQQIRTLQEIAAEVERLWQISLIRLRTAEEAVRRDIPIFGQDFHPTSRNVRRADIERDLLHNPDSAYRRLRLAMDLWNALWFWPVTRAAEAPNLDEWIATLSDLIGRDREKKNESTQRLTASLPWEELNAIEGMEAFGASAQSHERLLEKHPWVRIAQDIAAEQAFFHWDLDFAAVLSTGGFDLQVGNPPWVRPDVKVDQLLAEHDPWFVLATKPTQAAKNARREPLLEQPEVLQTVTSGITENVVLAEVLGDVTRYPYLKDQRPDLYRGFMNTTWNHMHEHGVTVLVHPESHFTEKKAVTLREGAYRRLRRHWQFINELSLFDVHHLVSYGVHIYGDPRDHADFLMACSLYHPSSAEDSLKHDGSGALPGFRDENNKWDLRPHRDRIQHVTNDTLRVWNSILEEPGTPILHSRMVYTVNTEAAAVLEKLAAAPRIGSFDPECSYGWDEGAGKKKGYFDTSWQHPDSWKDVILQGPHLGVSTPMIKQPNRTMKHNQDWSEVDLEAMPRDFIPATAYFPDRVEKKDYDLDYGVWGEGSSQVLVNSTYRVAWRRMAATTGFRTLYPSLIPRGCNHINGIVSIWIQESKELLVSGAAMSSILSDFYIRSTAIANIGGSTVSNLPTVTDPRAGSLLASRFLRLNCLTEAYAPLWEEVMGEVWTVDSPVRVATERMAVQDEIDAIVALSLGVSLEELLMIYRTQFPVMRRYDRENLYDAEGRLVPKDIAKKQEAAGPGVELPVEDRTWVHPQSDVEYVAEYPFAPWDREASLTRAYQRFQEEL
ncbi:class I SAM-dependent DNA methyltransferase [Corynebacterium uropygiale]|uniref:site-specific DNA-methyltransferase (adenine-specific) n=1 Tax=Corynebacterium uropygiale TaxID=1775911 RepID=A0A9X1U7Y6_9CORY|nr:DNA methyltransferase [Corynebacterium uropygiale]MCF4007222.1 class I SAM-dependent DNA methyltransferase [Corynebacterium uropygiale]